MARCRTQMGGWTKHYGIVDRMVPNLRAAYILVGTSQGIPRGDDGLRSAEFVVRVVADLEQMGLRKPTRFDARTHDLEVSEAVIRDLQHAGSVMASKKVVRALVSALAAARGFSRERHARRPA